QTVVDNLAFKLDANKCIALIGPNGAGKTTTLRMLTGLIKQTTGDMHFSGHNQSDFRIFTGYLPQHPVFYNWMSGLEYLFYCAKLPSIEAKEEKSRAEHFLKKTGILVAKHRGLGTFSGGWNQR